MASIKGVHVETLTNPVLFSQQQIEQACDIAWQLQRGKFVLTAVPVGWSPPEED